MESYLGPLLALAASFAVSFALTPLTGRIALRYGVIDHPSQDAQGYKQHAAPIPYLGGIALFAGLVVGSLFVFVVTEGIPVRHFVLTIGAALALGGIGLADDIRSLPRSLRFIVQVGMAIAAWSVGFGVAFAPWPFLNALITIIWVVGVTNAFNLLDNMDGVSAGLAGIASLAFATMGLLSGLPVLPTIAAALAGASFGFLLHNRHPAKVFMGDAGSLFLGFLVALLGIRLRFENLPQVTFMVPVVVLGLPILDTVLVLLSRFRQGRPLFLGARDHVAHRLVRLGLSIRTSVRLMYLAAIAPAWLGLVISRATPEVGFMLLGFVMAMGGFFTWYLLRVPVYDRQPVRAAQDLAPAQLDVEEMAQSGQQGRRIGGG